MICSFTAQLGQSARRASCPLQRCAALPPRQQNNTLSPDAPTLADPAARFGGGGAKSFGWSNLTYPHFQLSPRISATLFSKHRILRIFYFMFNFYINFCQIPQALRAEPADLAEGPSLAIKRPSLTSRRLLTRALEGGGQKMPSPPVFRG